MKTDRRNFIRNAGLLALAGFTGVENLFAISGYKVHPFFKKRIITKFFAIRIAIAPCIYPGQQFTENYA